MSDRPAETEYSALQALLQIRSNSSSQGGESGAAGEEAGGDAAVVGTANASQQTASANAASTTTTTAGVNNSNIANLLRMGASPASLLQATTQVPYTPAQLAAIRAAVATNFGRNGLLQASALQNPSFSAVAAAAAAAANRTDLAALHHQSPLLVEAMARDPSLAAAAVATAPLSPALELPPRSPALSPIRPSTGRGPSSPAGVATAKATQEAADGSEEAENNKKIRKDEVEAALRSKPQRGRKRENLNAEERLELTRTRNREHAKSTRIRKKARYQELLDTEQKYLEIKGEEEMNVKRRESVMKFLEARARMLSATARRRGASSAAGEASSGEANRDADRDMEQSRENRASENRAVSFDHAESLAGASSPAHGTADEEVAAKLCEILENARTFRFEASVADIQVHDYDALAQFDELMLGRFQDILSQGSSFRPYYRVIGSADGIALNKDGTGFARVELVAVPTSEVDPSPEASSSPEEKEEKEKTLQSAVVSFQFAGASPLISSVSWCIMKESTGTSSPSGSVNEGRSSDSTAKESLESQTVYPSVVSFDETHRDKARESATDQTPQGHHEHAEQSEENPGMSI